MNRHQTLFQHKHSLLMKAWRGHTLVWLLHTKTHLYIKVSPVIQGHERTDTGLKSELMLFILRMTTNRSSTLPVNPPVKNNDAQIIAILLSLITSASIPCNCFVDHVSQHTASSSTTMPHSGVTDIQAMASNLVNLDHLCRCFQVIFKGVRRKISNTFLNPLTVSLDQSEDGITK